MKAELKKIVEDNILAYYKSIARLLEGEFIESDNVSWYNTGRKSHFRFNGVVRTTPSADDLSKVVDPILEVFTTQELPFFWADWKDGDIPGLGDYLRSKKLSFRYLPGIPAMTRELKSIPELTLPEDVEVVQVQTNKHQADWLTVMMEGFQEPEPARPDIQQFVSNSLTEENPIFDHFLAYWQGTPCAVSTLLHASLAAGIYNVATIAPYRGRGLGRGMTLKAMQSAQESGYSFSMLFATPSGFPVYKRLGFEAISAADIYIWNGNS